MRRLLFALAGIAAIGCCSGHSPQMEAAPIGGGLWLKDPMPIFTDYPGWEGSGGVGEHQEVDVVKVGSTYHMFYAAGPQTGPIQIGVQSTSSAGYPREWVRNVGNPVLPSETQPMDTAPGAGQGFTSSPTIVRMQDNSWRMYYQGYDGTNTRVGVASTTAGAFPGGWTKYAGNPVLDIGAGGSWESTQVRPGAVIPAWEAPDNVWHMMYAGWNGTGGDGNNWRIGHATSADGIAWTKDPSNPVSSLGTVPGTFESGSVYPFANIKIGAIHYLFYIALDNTESPLVWRTGLAWTLDFAAWTKYSGNPVLAERIGAWDRYGASIDSVIYEPERGVFDLWYIGSNISVGSGFNIGLTRVTHPGLFGATMYGGTLR